MKSTKIKGYKVELTVCDDSTQCWVEKGKFSGSLALLMDMGILESREGFEHQVNEDTTDAILEWASANGY